MYNICNNYSIKTRESLSLKVKCLFTIKGNEMKFIKLSLAAALVASVAFAEEPKSDLEISANVAMTSNYVWRGMTQSSNSPAVQGGIDLAKSQSVYEYTYFMQFLPFMLAPEGKRCLVIGLGLVVFASWF